MLFFGECRTAAMWSDGEVHTVKAEKTHQTMCSVFFSSFWSRAWGELLSHESLRHSKFNLTAGAAWELLARLLSLRSDKQQMKKWKRKTTHKSYYLKLKKRRTTTIITCRMKRRNDDGIGTKEDENFICNLFILISRVCSLLSLHHTVHPSDSPRPKNSFRVI